MSESENGAIEFTPSFPPALEKQAAQLPLRGRSWLWNLMWLPLMLLFLLALNISDRMGSDDWFFMAGIGTGLAIVFLWAMVEVYANGRYLSTLTAEAREKAEPIRFRFTPKRFVLELSNARTEYLWSAIDEIAKLRGGTGLRIAAMVYAVADEDLPEGLDGDTFRARLNAWRDAA